MGAEDREGKRKKSGRERKKGGKERKRTKNKMFLTIKGI